MLNQYDPKDPNEVIVVSMDFSQIMGTDTVATCVVDIVRVDGASEVTTGMVVGVCDLSNKPIIKQKIMAGNSGVNYIVRFTAGTVSGQTIVASSTILVKNGGM